MFEQEPKSTWRGVIFALFGIGLAGGLLYSIYEMAKHIIEGK